MNLSPIQYSKLVFLFLVFTLFYLSSCKSDDSLPDPPSPIDYGYAIDIKSPLENSNYSIGDTLPISVDFSSETGEIVHYISAEIYSKTDKNLVLYAVQSHQHVLEYFEYHDDFILKDTSKIILSTDWVLETSMWSHEADADTVSATLELGIED